MKRLLRGNHSKAVNVAEVWASAGRVRDLIARKLAPRLSHPIADLRGRQWTTLSGRLESRTDRLKPVIERDHDCVRRAGYRFPSPRYRCPYSACNSRIPARAFSQSPASTALLTPYRRAIADIMS